MILSRGNIMESVRVEFAKAIEDPATKEVPASLIMGDPLYMSLARMLGESPIEETSIATVEGRDHPNDPDFTLNFRHGKDKAKINGVIGEISPLGKVLATPYLWSIEIDKSGRTIKAELRNRGYCRLEIDGEEYDIKIDDHRNTSAVIGQTPFRFFIDHMLSPDTMYWNTRLLERIDRFAKIGGGWEIQGLPWPVIYSLEDLGVPRYDSGKWPAEVQVFPAGRLFDILRYKIHGEVHGIDMSEITKVVTGDFELCSGNYNKIAVYFGWDEKIALIRAAKEVRSPCLGLMHPADVATLEETLFVPEDPHHISERVISSTQRWIETQYPYRGFLGEVKIAVKGLSWILTGGKASPTRRYEAVPFTQRI